MPYNVRVGRDVYWVDADTRPQAKMLFGKLYPGLKGKSIASIKQTNKWLWGVK